MGEFKPKINQPLEGVEHARWLEREREKDRKELSAVRAEQSRQAQNTASLGRRTIRTRSTAQTSNGLPDGGWTGNILRKVDTANGNATWTTEWQGLLPEFYVYLADGAAEYSVTDLDLGDDELTKSLLPPLVFSDDGKTLYPIDFGNYVGNTSVGILLQGSQGPFHLVVTVDPASEGEEFTIYLPAENSFFGSAAPYYTFELRNFSSTYGAVVHIEDTDLYYMGGSVPVNGDTSTWTIAPEYAAGWHVLNVRGWGAAVVPVRGAVTSPDSSDPYYDLNVGAMRLPFSVTKDGALSVATLPRRTYNDTVGDLTIGKVTASVGTAPSGVDLTLVVKKNGTSITTSFAVTTGTNTGTAVLSDTSWAVGDYLTIEVTQTGSAADLNVQIWAG